MTGPAREPVLPHSIWIRLSLLSGIVFFCMILAASISAPELPDSSLAVNQYAATYAQDHSGHVASTFFSGLAAVAFLLFLAGLSAYFRPVSGEHVALLSLMGWGGMIAIAMILLAQSVYAATAIGADTAGVPPGFVRGLDTLVPAITLYSGFPRSVFLLAAAAMIVKSNTGPRWLAFVGALAAVVGLIGTAAIFDLEGPLVTVGFLSMVLFALWVLLASATFLVRGSRSPAGASVLAPS